MNYGRAIRIVRTAYGLTLAQLAERLSVGASHLSLVESSKRQPSLKVLVEISVALEVPLHMLTLLASVPSELDDPNNAEQITNVAKALLRLLVSAGEQPTLPMRQEN